VRKITPKEVEDGMVLAEPLLAASGSVLMGKGATLRKSLVARLSAWGVASLAIEGEPTMEELTQGTGAWALKIPLDTLFAGRLVNEPMHLVYTALSNYLSGNASRQEGQP
jgi:hypothetical protein